MPIGEIRRADVRPYQEGWSEMARFQGSTFPECPGTVRERGVQLTSPRTRRRTAGADTTEPTQGVRPGMTKIRLKTFAISAIALLAAPTAAFGASGDDGYSPPGGQPQLAFTGRDLHLWGGLRLLLVGVGLGLRRLTAPPSDAKRARDDASATGAPEP